MLVMMDIDMRHLMRRRAIGAPPRIDVQLPLFSSRSNHPTRKHDTATIRRVPDDDVPVIGVFSDAAGRQKKCRLFGSSMAIASCFLRRSSNG